MDRLSWERKPLKIHLLWYLGHEKWLEPSLQSSVNVCFVINIALTMEAFILKCCLCWFSASETSIHIDTNFSQIQLLTFELFAYLNSLQLFPSPGPQLIYIHKSGPENKCKLAVVTIVLLRCTGPSFLTCRPWGNPHLFSPLQWYEIWQIKWTVICIINKLYMNHILSLGDIL